MWEIVRKSLAFGLGAAALTTDKIKEFADEAVERGEMSSDEAKKFIDDVAKRGDEQKKNVQKWTKEQVNKMLRQAGCVEASRVEELEKRVQALEAKLSNAETSAENEEVDCP